MNINTEQSFELIPTEALLDKAGGMRKNGYRLVQIGVTRLPDKVELTYSFDLNHQLANLRLHLPATDARIPSITSIYWGAFLYENELHDLFSIRVDGMAVDFHGHLYETAVKFPFGSTKPPEVRPTVERAVPSASSATSTGAPATARATST